MTQFFTAPKVTSNTVI